MIRYWRSIYYRNSFIVLFFTWLLAGCAGEPDPGGNPGNCRLTCSGSKIASKSMQILWQHDPGGSGDISVNCNGVEDKAVRSVPLRFLVDKPGEDINVKDESEEQDRLPVSGISFEVVVVSGHMQGTNADDPQDKYNGVDTPMDEWCTDACGVGSVDVSPKCLKEAQDVIILVRSGSISKKIKISTKPK